MNEKDNELDFILNQYSSKTGDKKSASIDELDEFLGSFNSSTTVDNAESHTEVEAPEAFETIDEAEEKFIDENVELSENDTPSDDLNEDDESDFSDDEDMTEIKNDVQRDAQDKKKAPAKRRKKTSKKKKSKVNSSIFVALIVVSILLTVSFAIAIFGINMGMAYLGVGKKDVLISLNIPKGSNSSDVTELLYKNGLIDNKNLFKVTLKLKKAGGSIKPGDITLKPSMGYDSIIQELCKMRESYDQVTITFKEGISLYDVAMLLEENDVCPSGEFLFMFNSENFGYDYENEISTNAEKYYKYEGMFFPDTYSFYIEDSAYNVVKNMRDQFENVMTKNKLYEKVKKSGLTFEEVIILASVVQAEAASADDMKNVASVFLNRLNNPDVFPKLESDATDNYYNEVIAPQNGDSISLAMFKDAYDTYVRKGLPAGAVGNPGLDAILAVVDAPETQYFYFCSNLQTKECFFAETLAEHEENLKKAGLVNE